MYDYLESMKNDIRDHIEWECDFREFIESGEFDRCGYWEKLNDALWIDDGVTGNASGSYWYNSRAAEEALAGNWDLLAEAMEEFCADWNELKRGAEYADVKIRCYLLGQAIDAVLDEMENGEFTPGDFADLMNDVEEAEESEKTIEIVA